MDRALPPSRGGHDTASSGKKAEAPPTPRSLPPLAEHAPAPALSRLRQNNQRRRNPPLSQHVGPRPLPAPVSHRELHSRSDGVGRPGRTKVSNSVGPTPVSRWSAFSSGPAAASNPSRIYDRGSGPVSAGLIDASHSRLGLETHNSPAPARLEVRCSFASR